MEEKYLVLQKKYKTLHKQCGMFDACVCNLAKENDKLKAKIEELEEAVEHYKEYERMYDELNDKINY